jgi:hypothetical protein
MRPERGRRGEPRSEKQGRRRAALLAALLVLFAGPAAAAPVSLDAFVTPVVEGFEGAIDPSQQQPVGAPPVPFFFQSGIVFVSPDRDLPGVVPFTVAELLAVPPGETFFYELGTNGTLSSPADLYDGTGFAASPEPPTQHYVFQLPTAVPRVGVHVSAFNGAPVTLRIFDELSGLIEEASFDTAPAPLDADNFVALESDGPEIAFFSLDAGANFAFDGVVFDLPEPSPAALCAAALMSLAWLARARRAGPAPAAPAASPRAR